MTGRAKQQHEEYRRECFAFDDENNELICPRGRRVPYRQTRRETGKEAHVYQATAQDCGPCPARPLCCPKLKLKSGGRSVSFTIHDPAIEAFDEKMARPEALAIYRKRAPLAEFPNAWIKTKLKLRPVRDTRAAQSSVRSHLGGLDIQPAAHVPAGPGLRMGRCNGFETSCENPAKRDRREALGSEQGRSPATLIGLASTPAAVQRPPDPKSFTASSQPTPVPQLARST